MKVIFFIRKIGGIIFSENFHKKIHKIKLIFVKNK